MSADLDKVDLVFPAVGLDELVLDVDDVEDAGVGHGG